MSILSTFFNFIKTSTAKAYNYVKHAVKKFFKPAIDQDIKKTTFTLSEIKTELPTINLQKNYIKKNYYGRIRKFYLSDFRFLKREQHWEYWTEITDCSDQMVYSLPVLNKSGRQGTGYTTLSKFYSTKYPKINLTKKPRINLKKQIKKVRLSYSTIKELYFYLDTKHEIRKLLSNKFKLTNIIYDIKGYYESINKTKISASHSTYKNERQLINHLTTLYKTIHELEKFNNQKLSELNKPIKTDFQYFKKTDYFNFEDKQVNKAINISLPEISLKKVKKVINNSVSVPLNQDINSLTVKEISIYLINLHKSIMAAYHAENKKLKTYNNQIKKKYMEEHKLIKLSGYHAKECKKLKSEMLHTYNITFEIQNNQVEFLDKIYDFKFFSKLGLKEIDLFKLTNLKKVFETLGKVGSKQYHNLTPDLNMISSGKFADKSINDMLQIKLNRFNCSFKMLNKVPG